MLWQQECEKIKIQSYSQVDIVALYDLFVGAISSWTRAEQMLVGLAPCTPHNALAVSSYFGLRAAARRSHIACPQESTLSWLSAPFGCWRISGPPCSHFHVWNWSGLLAVSDSLFAAITDRRAQLLSERAGIQTTSLVILRDSSGYFCSCDSPLTSALRAS